MRPPTLFFFFQDCFDHLRSHDFPYEFKTFSISANRHHWDFNKDCTESADSAG